MSDDEAAIIAAWLTKHARAGAFAVTYVHGLSSIQVTEIRAWMAEEKLREEIAKAELADWCAAFDGNGHALRSSDPGQP